MNDYSIDQQTVRLFMEFASVAVLTVGAVALVVIVTSFICQCSNRRKRRETVRYLKLRGLK